ncbi:hypothetical protein T484DRAFT_1812879 [Baffinella frigidus]|nr:hypothetical protein T484DRAFT_1812879 [Cryptophyta sp. CCMP2293]
MHPQKECVDTVKEMMAEVIREKKELVERLNEMHQGIEEEEDLLTKVLRKVEWMEEKERSVEALNRIVASLQGVFEEEDMTGEMAPAGRGGSRSASQDGHDSTATREDSDTAASRDPGAFSQSFNTRASAVHRTQTDGERTERTVTNLTHAASQEAGPSDPPRLKANRASSTPPHAPAAEPRHKADRASSAPSAPATRPLSDSFEQLPRQLRQSFAKKLRRVSSSVLRTIGWNPALQVAAPAWDYSV